MKKIEFISELARHLAGLPQEDAAHWLEYYTEMLDDRIEDGMSEEEATASLGDPKAIARQILSQTPFTKLIKNKIRPDRSTGQAGGTAQTGRGGSGRRRREPP